MRLVLILLLIIGFLSAEEIYRKSAGNKISKNVMAFFDKAPDDSLKVWILFTDKGMKNEMQVKSYLASHSDLVSKRSLDRRKRRKTGSLLEYCDIPVKKEYVSSLEQMGLTICTKSKWLNAISTYIKKRDIQKIAESDFVYSVIRVAVFKRRKVILDKKGLGYNGDTDPFYGYSHSQIYTIGVMDAHKLGLTGKGILICMLDGGFMLDHESLRHISKVDEYDFINKDNFTGYDKTQDTQGQPSHGTMTLSTIGGYAPGKLIGPAYEADYLLYKTEDDSDETEIEETYWTEGIEKADSLGADIVNSSLGYSKWYSYEDFDGHTAVTTLAASRAAQNGIIVCNSMGNEGTYDYDEGTLVAPADADSILSLGAIFFNGHLCAFSSTGPTYGGGNYPSRIKPDLVAPGSSVIVAYPYTIDEYTSASGTSFSSPLTAGAVALVLQAFPDMKVYDVIKFMKDNADKRVKDFNPSQGTLPNNFYGWGITYLGNALSGGRIYAYAYDAISQAPLENVEIMISGPEQAEGKTKSNGGYSGKFTKAGTYSIQASLQGYETQSSSVSFNGTNGAGCDFPMLKKGWSSSTRSLGAFPNPSKGEIWFGFELLEKSEVTIKIYNSNGTLIKDIVVKDQEKGIHMSTTSGSAIYWDGKDKNNVKMGSGIYLYVIKIGDITESGKFAIIR
ncbi:MAG: S8 family serine peptidase [Candidatus Coatesbacteria bacterium]|nr:S8 family serine peptidase [Candidatus Coatesbacteria bacterium]